MRPTVANFGTYAFKNVGADALTTGRLSAGWYSLSSLSTVPYVSLVGQEGRGKIFSWGEIIQIPEGSIATVKNSSFHAGDIFINGGKDYATLPRRVTVPVPLTIAGGPGEQLPWNIQTPFVDTRRCRAAWLVVNILTVTGGNGNALVLGSNETHSNPTGGFVTFTGGQGFSAGHALLAGTTYHYLPLGFGSSIDQHEPMALLDKGRVVITLPEDSVFTQNLAYYVLEY